MINQTNEILEDGDVSEQHSALPNGQLGLLFLDIRGRVRGISNTTAWSLNDRTDRLQ